jgi:hypothetical protein
MLEHFNRWLQSKGLAAEQIDSSTIERYVRCRRKSGKLRKGDGAALVRMWRMLRPGQARMPSSPPSACEMSLWQFQHYLRQERGLTEATITSYTPVVRAFLAECFPTDDPDFHQLCGSAVVLWVLCFLAMTPAAISRRNVADSDGTRLVYFRPHDRNQRMPRPVKTLSSPRITVASGVFDIRPHVPRRGRARLRPSRGA